MSPLIAGDPVIDDQHPVQILVADPSGADLVTGATAIVGEYFQITACNSLAQASDCLRTQFYDVIVLEPHLPDCWPADSYRRLSEVADGVPFLILTPAQDLGFLAQASPLPFAVLAKDEAEPATIRRLLISAALRKRALTRGAPRCATRARCLRIDEIPRKILLSATLSRRVNRLEGSVAG